jgi:hypothetical protein
MHAVLDLRMHAAFLLSRRRVQVPDMHAGFCFLDDI